MSHPRRSAAAALATFVLTSIALPARAPMTAAADDLAPASRLLSTAQAWGYVGNRGERADGNGDDGDLVRGRAAEWSFADVVTPTSQAENVALDRNTGLMWLRRPGLLDAADGVGVHGNVPFNVPMGWQGALDAARDLEYAGFNDWRLPNVNELETITDFSQQAYALDPQVFGRPGEGESLYVWSSTTSPPAAGEAYYLNTFDGHIYPWEKPWHLVARPVRSAAVADPVAVFRTGQTRSYRGTGGDEGPGNADDGALRLGLASDYAYADDGTIDTAAENVVLDRATKLHWVRDPRVVVDDRGGAVAAFARPVDWQTAVALCRDLAYAGHDDWRLPNLRELWSLARPGDPAGLFDAAAFPRPPVSPDPENPFVWWSSTTTAGDHPSAPAADRAWFLSTAFPVMRHHVGPEFQPPKSRPGYVRCVRDASPDVVPALWRPAVRSATDWTALTVAIDRPDVWREGKWLAAAAPDAAAPFDIAFQDANRFPLHLDFLRAAFPERYDGLDPVEYTAIAAHRATRRLLAGGLRSFGGPDGTSVYGFDVWTADGEPDELLTLDETLALHRRLSRAFRRRPLVYAPTQPDAVALARSWAHPGLPIGFPSAPPPVSFEAYTRGIAYGTVRRVTVDDLVGAGTAGTLSWQDVVVAGVVTGARQGPLSHLNVRLGRRGTPNAYVEDAHAAFAPHDGRLVRLEVDAAGYRVVPDISVAEASAWWAAHRPPPVDIVAPDVRYDGLDDLATIAAGDVITDPLRTATRRFGGKAANLARLYAFLPDEHEVPGFGIPFSAYDGYVRTNAMPDPRTPGGPPVPYADVIAALHADPRFMVDPAYRAPLLAAVFDALDGDGEPDKALVAALATRIDAVFGPGVMVRFRSSSNAEDGVAFNGAGLYNSTSVCVADSLDADKAGPSRCDPNQPKERTIERGLRTVWASLWNPRAWSERTYFRIDPARAAMAILVTPAFPDERANGVAFTGDPSGGAAGDGDGDEDGSADRGEMIVNAQDGDASVVLPESGDLPERAIIAYADGAVTGIRRVQPSSRVPPGTHVVADDELRQLGALLLLAKARMPIDTAGHAREDVLLDVEWKIRRGDNALLVKQIRPFVAASSAPPAPDLHVIVPAALQLCTMWRPSSPPAAEYAAKRVLDLARGEATVPLSATHAAHDLFAALSDGRDGTPAVPEEAGEVTITDDAGRPGYRRVQLRRRFRLGEAQFEARLYLYDVRADQPYLVRLDSDALTAGNVVLTLADVSAGPDAAPEQILGPCGLPVLPRQRYDLRLADGGRVSVMLRKGRGFFSYRWATLIGAVVDVPDGRAEVRDLRRLVYSAMRHNWSERLVVVFDPPLGELGAVHGIEIAQDGTNPGDGTYTAVYLGADLQPLRTVAVVGMTITGLPPEGADYRIVLPWAVAGRP